MREFAVLTLDLDDTLWPCWETIRSAEQVLFTWLDEHAPGVTRRHTIQSLREHRLSVAQRHPGIAHDMTELRLRALRELLTDHGHDPALAATGSALFRRERNRVTPYPDVPDALRALRDRFTLVSLTNGNAQVEHTPLRGCFDHAITAADVGAAKPDPRMFERARDLCDVEWSDMLHVGDDPLRDIRAAADLGIATAWMNRRGEAWPGEHPRPWLEVADMGALVERLME